MMKVVLLLTAALLGDCCVPRYSPEPACLCGVPLYKRRIVGGVDAMVNQYPWQVGLMDYVFDRESKCGGTLLSSDTVLTAAHCVEWQTSVVVAFPKEDLSLENAEKIQSSEILIHPYYGNGLGVPGYDFAIIKLSRPVQFDDSIQPICLPNPTEAYDDNLAEVTGWGQLGGTMGTSTILQTVNVTTMTNKKCQELFDTLSNSYNPAKITPDMLCAADPGKDSCYGDSGGPLITLNKEESYYSQIGVVSWGFGCATATPGVYSRVTDQMYWIMKQITGDTCPPPTR